MINVTRSTLPDFEEYCNEIKSIWDNHWLTNMGEKHNRLQEELEKFLECPHVVLFTNGHLALENAISSFHFPPGSEVITTPFTFVSTTHAIVRNGLKPVFCDIRWSDYTIDVEKIEELITEKTVAILPVHVYGNICDVEKLDAISQKYNVKLIYDAAHAFGVKYKGRSSADFGDVSMFSFHATKVFNTIEGGAVCFKEESRVSLLNDLKNFGIHGPEEVHYIGGNAKMNEFQAAMGICNLKHLSDGVASRKLITERYRERLGHSNGIIINELQENVESNYAYFPVVFDGYKKTRDDVYKELQKHDIIVRKYFYPLTNTFECYSKAEGYAPQSTPVASYIADRVLTLPIYPDLSMQDVDRICNIILE